MGKKRDTPLMKPRRFAEGFAAPFSAFGFWVARPRLWMFGVWPILINLALTAGVAYSGYRWAFVPLMARLGQKQGFWEHVWRIAAGVGIVLGLLVAGVFLFVVLATILGAPFYDLMGERIEKEAFEDQPELTAEGVGFWRGVRFSLGEAARRLGFLIPLALLGLLFGFVPVVGPVLGVIVAGTATGLFLVLDAWSYPLDRRHVPFRAKIGYVRRHFTMALGLGTGLFLLYLIPCAWFFVPPLAAIAGTRLYCGGQLQNGGKSSPAPARRSR